MDIQALEETFNYHASEVDSDIMRSILSEILRIILRKPPANINHEFLRELDYYITTGDIEEGIGKIEKFEEQIKEDNSFAKQILLFERVRYASENNDIEKANDLLDSFNMEETHPIVSKNIKIERSNLKRIQGEFNEALQLLEEPEQEIKKLKWIYPYFYRRITARMNNIKAKIYNRTGNFEESQRLLRETLDLLDQIDYEKQKAEPLNDLGIAFASVGDADNALKHFNEALDIYNDVGNKTQSLKINNNIGLFLYNLGELDEALEYLETSLELSNELSIKRYAASILLNIGLIYQSRGNIEKSKENFLSSLELFEELENKPFIANVKSNLANIYLLVGDLDLAIQAFKEAQEIWEELDSKNDLAHLYNNFAGVYREKGMYSKTLELAKKSVELTREIGNYSLLPQSLWVAIEASCDLNNVDEAREYFQVFEEEKENFDTKLAEQLVKLSEARILLESERVVKRAEAQRLLQEIAEDEVISISYTIEALLQLGNLLLQELQVSASEEALNEFKDLINTLDTVTSEAGTDVKITPTQVQVLILRSKLALIDLEIEEAQRLLDEAHELATSNGLKQHAITVDREREAVKNQMMKYKQMVDTNASLYERLQESQIENYLQKAENILKK